MNRSYKKQKSSAIQVHQAINNVKKNLSNQDIKQLKKRKIDNISQKIQNATKDWNIDAIVKAVIADDPDMAEHIDDFRDTLMQIKTENLKNALRAITSPS